MSVRVLPRSTVSSKLRALLAASLAVVIATFALGQQLPGVGVSVEFPEVGSLTISASEVRFDLSGADYPPKEFPAYYAPVAPAEPMTITVVSNGSGWRLMAAFPGLFNSEANVRLDAQQLEYSIDGSTWFPFQAGGVNLDVAPSSGPASLAAPQVHVLQLRLVVTGNEVPGKYEGTLTFSLVSQ